MGQQAPTDAMHVDSATPSILLSEYGPHEL